MFGVGPVEPHHLSDMKRGRRLDLRLATSVIPELVALKTAISPTITNFTNSFNHMKHNIKNLKYKNSP